MKKVLFLQGSYKPNPSANGICTEAVMRELVKDGYAVTGIVYKKPGVPFCDDDNGITLHRIKPVLARQIELLVASRKKNKPFLLLIAKYIDILRTLLSLFWWPLHSSFLALRYYRKAVKLYKYEKFDCVICINLPYDTVYAGYLLKKRFPQIKYIPYFLDPLSEGVRYKFHSDKTAVRRSLKAEKKCITASDKTIAMASHMPHFEKYYNGEILDKIKFLDIPLLAEPVNTNSADHKSTSTINILYTGGLSKASRNPSYIIDVLSQFINVKLTFIVSNNAQWVKELAAGKNNIHVLERIPHSEVIKKLQQADILLNIGNSQELYVPSKLFEYMSACKPIISTYRIDNDTCLGYLEKYPLSSAIDERKDIAVNIKNIEDFLTKSSRMTVNYEDLKHTFYNNTPKAFATEIGELVL